MKTEDSKVKSGQAHISVQITIVNGTQFPLDFDKSIMEGHWNGGPVNNVDPYTIRVVGQDDSNDGVTGVKGFMKYHIRFNGVIVGTIIVKWDNPDIGSNSYSCSVESASQYQFYINYVGSSGDNSGVTYILCQASPYSGN